MHAFSKGLKARRNRSRSFQWASFRIDSKLSHNHINTYKNCSYLKHLKFYYSQSTKRLARTLVNGFSGTAEFLLGGDKCFLVHQGKRVLILVASPPCDSSHFSPRDPRGLHQSSWGQLGGASGRWKPTRIRLRALCAPAAHNVRGALQTTHYY